MTNKNAQPADSTEAGKKTAAPDQSVVRWQFDEFQLLQVTPCHKMLAVYAMEDESQPGKHKLEAYPIHFIAVAKVTTRFLERPKSAPKYTCGMEYQKPDVRNDIVGLDLVDGLFEVCNEASNFAGYCREGDDISLATDYLHAFDYPLST